MISILVYWAVILLDEKMNRRLSTQQVNGTKILQGRGMAVPASFYK
jgi:hypothetical protein